MFRLPKVPARLQTPFSQPTVARVHPRQANARTIGRPLPMQRQNHPTPYPASRSACKHRPKSMGRQPHHGYHLLRQELRRHGVSRQPERTSTVPPIRRTRNRRPLPSRIEAHPQARHLHPEHYCRWLQRPSQASSRHSLSAMPVSSTANHTALPDTQTQIRSR